MDLKNAFREFDSKFFSDHVYQQDKTIRELLEEYWNGFDGEFNQDPTIIWDPRRLVNWWKNMWDEMDIKIEREVLETMGVPKEHL